MKSDLFVSHETAKLAKEKGFPQGLGSGLGAYVETDNGLFLYHNAYPIGSLVAPLYQQLID